MKRKVKEEVWGREDALVMLKEIATNAALATVKEKDGEVLFNSQIASVAIKAIEQCNKMCGYISPEKTVKTQLTMEDTLKDISGERF